MTNRHGEFIWYELMTSDPDAAAAFYGAVVGWGSHGFDESMGGYRAFEIGGTDVGGLMAIPEEAAGRGAQPAWCCYVGVDDVDATAADVVAAGGSQCLSPRDIPGVGRFAMLADPQGAMFYIMRGASDDTSTSFSQEVGHCNWNELGTGDPVAALAFYSARFGWQKGETMPMGEMGDYQIFDHHGEMIGAMMRQVRTGMPPAWLFYFGVGDIDAAAKAVTDNGGTINDGPMDVPGGSFAVVASDPQGAMFGIVGPRTQQPA